VALRGRYASGHRLDYQILSLACRSRVVKTTLWSGDEAPTAPQRQAPGPAPIGRSHRTRSRQRRAEARPDHPDAVRSSREMRAGAPGFRRP